MLVVAVVVGVSIKITKAKLDHIISYTYYSAYSTLRNVSGQMIQDFKATDNSYTDTAHLMPQTLLALFMPKQRAEATQNYIDLYSCAYQVLESTTSFPYLFNNGTGYPYESRNSKLYTFLNYGTSAYTGGPAFGSALQNCREISNGNITNNLKNTGNSALNLFTVPYAFQGVASGSISNDIAGFSFNSSNINVCPGKFKRSAGDRTEEYFDYISRQLDTTYSINVSNYRHLWDQAGLSEDTVEALKNCNYSCNDGVNNNCGAFVVASYPNRFVCEGSHYGTGDIVYFPDSEKNVLDHWPVCRMDRPWGTPDPEPNVCENQPSAEEIQTRHHETGDVWSGYPECTYKPTCNQEGYYWNPATETCTQEPPTIPRKGINFCEKFVSYTNTKANSPECTGDAVANNTTDFSSLTADITLRNGMRLYNVRQNPAEIAILTGNTPGGKYGNINNVNTYGYTVYVDIDGEKGRSQLWQDVYKFYITMSGKVVPAYNETAGADPTGGNSRQHLMTSVEKENVVNGARTITWYRKSVTYQEGACSAGYLQGAYCQGGGTPVQRLPQCNDTINTCIMKHISPVKFF